MLKAEKVQQYLVEKHGYKYQVQYNNSKKEREQVQPKKSHFFHKTMRLIPFDKPAWKFKVEEVLDLSTEAKEMIREMQWEIADTMNDHP